MLPGDTIVALSSGAPPSGVAVVRVSGPKAGALVQALGGRLPTPRVLTLLSLRAGADIFDQGLVAWFPAPASFTGEDCAEFHLHGSRAVVRAILAFLCAQGGVRLAEAGEFTRRAFENGKLDLAKVAGLGDLIAAETETQRKQALTRLQGGLSRRIETWRAALLDLRAELEAHIDFSDESDVADVVPGHLGAQIESLRRELEATLAGYARGRMVRDGIRVALAGPPNAGKSSLLNRLAASDIAIVTDEPGTTRDVREVQIELAGTLVVLVDMAGLRTADGKAEAEGLRRARLELERADLVLWLNAPDTVAMAPDAELAAPIWPIATKADLNPGKGRDEMTISSLSGEGMDELVTRLTSFSQALAGTGGEPSLISHERDRLGLEAAILALGEASKSLDALELCAEALRSASKALERLIGRLDAEAVLDQLFSAFCIGK